MSYDPFYKNMEYQPNNLRIVPLIPYEWPQDKLEQPWGRGEMPRINAFNAAVTKREGFSIPVRFDGVTWGTTQTVIVPTEQSADFWCTDIITINPFNNATGLPTGAHNNPYLTIKDLRTDIRLCDAPVAWQYFSQPNVVAAGLVPVGNSAAVQVRNPFEPFCFTRDGGISVTLMSQAAAAAAVNYSFLMVFVGWKEYANAAK